MPSKSDTALCAAQIEQLLAQTQCRECGFEGCAPYAQAIAAGEAEINLCRPGGERVMVALSQLTGKPELPPAQAQEPLLVARIDEETCIGCTLCIQACPTQAIVGTAKRMHTVVAQDCTGCRLCLPPCPVDCIRIVPAPQTLFPDQPDTFWYEGRAAQVRGLVLKKQARRRRERIQPQRAKPQYTTEEKMAPEAFNPLQSLPLAVRERIETARAAARLKAEKMRSE